MTLKHPPGPPMDLANMRRQGVRSLIACCLNYTCRHQAVIDVSKYPGDTLVPWFRSRKSPSWVDVRPELEEGPETPIKLDCRLIPWWF